jgi:DNA-binding transcriptional LysR family regulator
MELTWIDDFLALNAARNFTRAAEARHATQSAFSRRIQRLEEWLGAALFNRDVTPAALTPAGEEFAKRAQRLREDILDARRVTLSVASHFEQTLRIITTNTIATSFLPSWLATNKFENYSLVVASNTGCLEALRQRRANLALISRFGEDEELDGLQQKIVGEDALILVASPAVRPKIRLEKGQLSGPLMAYTPGTAYGAQIAEMLKRQHIRMPDRLVCESASAEALLAQVKAGLGAAWLPRFLVESPLKRCAAPDAFDIPYKIILVNAGKTMGNH